MLMVGMPLALASGQAGHCRSGDDERPLEDARRRRWRGGKLWAGWRVIEGLRLAESIRKGLGAAGTRPRRTPLSADDVTVSV